MKDEKNSPGREDELEALRRRVRELEATEKRLRQSQEALRESEEKCRLLFETAPAGIGIADLAGEVLIANKAILEMLGYTLAELRSVNIRSTYADPDCRERLLKKLAETGSVRDFEVRLRRKDGTIYSALLNADLIEMGGRKLVFTTIRDVTEQEQVRESLANQKELLASVLAHVPYGVFWKDRDSVYLGCNESFARSAGVASPEDVIGKTDFDLAIDRQRARAYRAGDRQVLKSGRAVLEKEETVLALDGRETSILTSKVPLRNAAGEIIGVLGVLADITARKQAEQDLSESEEKWRSLVENAPNIIVSVDRDGTIQFINRTASGAAREEHIGKRVYDSIEPGYHEVARETIARVFRTGRPGHYEARALGPGGRWSLYEVQVGPVRRGGKVVGATLIATDITERKRARQALEESERHERRFRERLARLHGVTIELSMAGSFDELCRRAVELGRSELGFDRMSLWFLVEPPDLVQGSFGVDEAGGIRDERGTRGPVGTDSFMGKVLANKMRVAVVEDMELVNNDGEAVGRGTGVIAALWDGQRAIGCLCADNLLTGWPMTTDRCELLALYALGLGHLCSRVRSDEVLRESEERYRTLVGNIPGAVYRGACDADWTTHFVSDAIEALCGYPALDFIGSRARTYTSIIHPEDRAAVEKAILAGVAGRESYVIEYRILHADGSVRWVYDKGQGIFGDNGKLLWLDGVVFDVTEQKEAEEELRIKDSAIESSISAISLCDLDGRISYVNPSFLKMWGYDSDWEVLGRSTVSFWRHGRQAAKVMAAMKSQGSWTGEMTGKRKDETTFEVNLATSVVTDERGRPICMMASFVDVTDRKRAEEALRQSKDRLQYVIDNTSDIIFEIDLAGNYTFANRAAERITGYPLARLLTMNMVELIVPEHRERILERLRGRIAGRTIAQPFAFDILRPDGRRVALELTTTGVYEGRTLVAVQGIARDITERVRAEKELRAARARLVSAREAERKRLAGELHGSVQQGLLVLKLGVHGLLPALEKGLGAEAAGTLERMRSQCDALIGEVRQACHGLYPPTLESLGLRSALEQLAREFPKQSEVAISCSISPAVGRFPAQVEIALFRIAQEAITNALRHGRPRRVVLGLSYENGQAVLTVTDNGEGFDPAEAAGKGLGLAIMREHAQAVGGTWEVASRRRRTRVTVIVPTELTPRPPGGQ